MPFMRALRPQVPSASASKKRHLMPPLQKHASVFDPKKYHMVRFMPPRLQGYASATDPLDLPKKLHWDAHIKHLKEKSIAVLSCIPALGGSSWGVTPRKLRHVYTANVLPIFLYCASVWYSPSGGQGTKERSDRTLRVLRAIQRRAAIMVAETFRTTAGASLDVKLHLLPVEQQLKRCLNDALLRIVSGPIHSLIMTLRPPTHTEQPLPLTTTAQYARLSPLNKLKDRFKHVYDINPLEIEQRRAFVVPP